MIINVRGTHGSGKTELVRRVMKRYRTHKPIHVDGRRLPIGYVCRGSENGRALFVPGHYNPGTLTGGCDTIKDVKTMFRLIRRYAEKDCDVIFEGILAQHSTPNIVKLHADGFDVRVVILNLPIKRSIRGIYARRHANKNYEPLDETNARKEAVDCLTAGAKCRDGGVRVVRKTSRKSALRYTLKLLFGE